MAARSVLRGVALIALAGSGIAGCTWAKLRVCDFENGRIATELGGEARAYVDDALGVRATASNLESTAENTFRMLSMALGGDGRTGQRQEEVLQRLDQRVRALVSTGCTVAYRVAGLEAALAPDAGPPESTIRVHYAITCDPATKDESAQNIQNAVNEHGPALVSLVVGYRALAPRVRENLARGEALSARAESEKPLEELRCAQAAMRTIPLDERLALIARLEASAKGVGH